MMSRIQIKPIPVDLTITLPRDSPFPLTSRPSLPRSESKAATLSPSEATGFHSRSFTGRHMQWPQGDYEDSSLYSNVLSMGMGMGSSSSELENFNLWPENDFEQQYEQPYYENNYPVAGPGPSTLSNQVAAAGASSTASSSSSGPATSEASGSTSRGHGSGKRKRDEFEDLSEISSPLYGGLGYSAPLYYTEEPNWHQPNRNAESSTTSAALESARQDAIDPRPFDFQFANETQEYNALPVQPVRPSPQKKDRKGKGKAKASTIPSPEPVSETPRVKSPPQNLSSYICPICFSSPTNATMTLCGHICCGSCLFTAVNTTLRHGRNTGEPLNHKDARCPVCRALIPGWNGLGGGVIGLQPRAIYRL